MTPEEVMPSGYDEQERFFHEKDIALLKKKREELDAARREREQQAVKAEHWMKCPKCGADLQEIEMDGGPRGGHLSKLPRPFAGNDSNGLLLHAVLG